MISLFSPLVAAGALILFSCGVGAQASQPDTSNPPPQTQSAERQETFSQAELEQLVAPIALYSDSLLARVLMASTHPLDVVEASRWVLENKSLQGSELLAAAEKQRWDYSVMQLTATPSVLTMMSDKLDWTKKLGDAVLVQQPDVLDAVQRVRAVAQAQDKLKATNEQKVVRRTEDNRNVVGAAAPDTSNPPQTRSGERQEQRGAVAQVQDKLKTTNEQKVARRTEDNKDVVGAVAHAPPQPDTSNPPPQTQSGERQKNFSQPELEQLVAPIALYSDPLLARVLMASTYSLEVVEARRWVEQNKSLKGSELKAAADQQRWDYSVKQLTATPSVLAMMSDKLDWTKRLGDAVLAQQPDVMDAVQRLRVVAQAQDKLKTTNEQKVSRRPQGNRDVVVIEPARPDTIYVPYYDPAIVYGVWPYPAHPPFHWPGYYDGPDTQTAGIVFAAFGVDAWSVHWGGDFDWHRHDIYYRRDLNNINRDARRWSHLGVADRFDRNRDNRDAAQLSRDNQTFTAPDRQGREANVDNRAGSDRSALQKAAWNRVKHAGPSQKRVAQQRPANLSANRGDRERAPGRILREPENVAYHAPDDRRRPRFAAQRSGERAARGGGEHCARLPLGCQVRKVGQQWAVLLQFTLLGR